MPGVGEDMLSGGGKEVFLACGATDMRKSINGLSILVQSSFALDPFTGALFVFCNKKRNRLKVPEWAGDGFRLHLKRPERGHFKWPEALNDEKTMVLSEAELSHLPGSPGPEQKLRRQQIEEKMAL